jgi:hypothetical protein
MGRRTLRRGSAALVAVLLAAGPLEGARAAEARSAAACPAGDGITVVVDFGTQGGGVQIRCVTQSVTSGFDALTKAGFTFDTTVRFGGLLCRIDGKPTPADEGCINAPPPDRYWAYWTATLPGGAWTYSDQGAGNRVPPPGSVEGWAFSDGCDRKPGSGPCPTSSTTSTTTRAATTTTAGPSAGVATSTTAGQARTDVPGGTSTTRTRDGSTTTTDPAGDRAPAAGEEGDDEEEAIGAAAEPAAARDDADSGSATGVLVVVLVLLGLGATSVAAVRRRRRNEAGP